jgi:hypothetical protein
MLVYRLVAAILTYTVVSLFEDASTMDHDRNRLLYVHILRVSAFHWYEYTSVTACKFLSIEVRHAPVADR